MNRVSLLILFVSMAWPWNASAFQVQDGIVPASDRNWLVDQVETVRRTGGVQDASFNLSNAQVWSRGLEETGEGLPVPAPLDKAMGARLRLFKDYNLQVGTELSRQEDTGRALRSQVNWQFSWSRAVQELGGITVGFGTAGAVESLDGVLSQSVSGSVGVPLVSHEIWKARLRLSPRLSYDSLDHRWRPSFAPELVSETVLSSATAPFTSLLNVRFGYDLAPESRPSASARVELRFIPRP
jgi:hypothetical protein